MEKVFLECAFSPDGERLGAISADGYLVFWNPRDGVVLEK